jgi:hypothetical protein
MRTAREIYDDLKAVERDQTISGNAAIRRAARLWHEARQAGLDREVLGLIKAEIDVDRRECRRVMAENGWTR